MKNMFYLAICYNKEQIHYSTGNYNCSLQIYLTSL